MFLGNHAMFTRIAIFEPRPYSWSSAFKRFLFSPSLPCVFGISLNEAMPFNHLIVCRPLLFLPSIFPSIYLIAIWISQLWTTHVWPLPIYLLAQDCALGKGNCDSPGEETVPWAVPSLSPRPGSCSTARPGPRHQDGLHSPLRTPLIGSPSLRWR